MKTAATKREFVRLRAEGKSFSAIAGELHISKTTCTKWDRALASEVAEAKKAELAALAEEYALTKTARIKSFGETLRAIDGAIARKGVLSMPPAQLLAMKLKYMEALKGEGIDQSDAPRFTYDNLSEEAILKAFCGILDRVRAGEDVNIQAEARLLDEVRDAYKATQTERMYKGFAQVALSRMNENGDYYDDEDDEEAEDGN